MSEDYSREALLSFIKQCVMTGVVNPATGRSRQNAARHLLPLTTEDERRDVRRLDLAELAGRFHKLDGSSIRPESLDVYQRRLQAAIDDFLQWRSDPDGFTPSRQSERSLIGRPDADSFTPKDHLESARESLELNPPREPGQIFPVPIREDLIVYLQNIPLDLSQSEAARICRIVQSLAEPEEQDDQGSAA